jgi:hypothetical protein
MHFERRGEERRGEERRGEEKNKHTNTPDICPIRTYIHGNGGHLDAHARQRNQALDRVRDVVIVLVMEDGCGALEVVRLSVDTQYTESIAELDSTSVTKRHMHAQIEVPSEECSLSSRHVPYVSSTSSTTYVHTSSKSPQSRCAVPEWPRAWR